MFANTLTRPQILPFCPYPFPLQNHKYAILIKTFKHLFLINNSEIVTLKELPWILLITEPYAFISSPSVRTVFKERSTAKAQRLMFSTTLVHADFLRVVI